MSQSFRFFLFLACLLSAGIAHAASNSKTFSNPVFPYDWPDPTVWQGDDGRYYTFSTAGAGEQYHAYLGQFLRSDDMVTWDTIPGNVWSRETRNNAINVYSNGTHVWAPQVVKVNGHWLMYISCVEGGNTAKNSSIMIFSYSSDFFPAQEGGLWRYENTLQDSRTTKIVDTIDPFVTTDPATGKVWMFYGSTGKNYRVELSSDGLSIKNDSSPVHVAGLSGSGNNREQTFEGAYLYFHDGYWYYFVSSGSYEDYNYALRVARSKTIDGVFKDRNDSLMTNGYATKILSSSRNDDFWGPGHNAEIFTDAAGKTYMYYHSHAKKLNKDTRRALMLQEILWDNEGWPYFEGGKPKEEETWPAFEFEFSIGISSAGWSTIYLPYAFDVPQGMEVYTVTEEMGVLIKTPVSRTLANHAYLVHAAPGTYKLRGIEVEEVNLHRNGNLIGVVTDNYKLQDGDYVLQNHNGRVGFYRVNENNKKINAHKAFLRIDSSDKNRARSYDIEGDELGIDEVEPESSGDSVQIIGMDGEPLPSAPVNRPFLIRTVDGTVRKSLIR